MFSLDLTNVGPCFDGSGYAFIDVMQNVGQNKVNVGFFRVMYEVENEQIVIKEFLLIKKDLKEINQSLKKSQEYLPFIKWGAIRETVMTDMGEIKSALWQEVLKQRENTITLEQTPAPKEGEVAVSERLNNAKITVRPIEEGRAMVDLIKNEKTPDFYLSFRLDVNGEAFAMEPIASFRVSKEEFLAWYEQNKEKLFAEIFPETRGQTKPFLVRTPDLSTQKDEDFFV